eukprot:4595931-Pyramimonas_sp.AAC.1
MLSVQPARKLIQRGQFGQKALLRAKRAWKLLAVVGNNKLLQQRMLRLSILDLACLAHPHPYLTDDKW